MGLPCLVAAVYGCWYQSIEGGGGGGGLDYLICVVAKDRNLPLVTCTYMVVLGLEAGKDVLESAPDGCYGIYGLYSEDW